MKTVFAALVVLASLSALGCNNDKPTADPAKPATTGAKPATSASAPAAKPTGGGW